MEECYTQLPLLFCPQGQQVNQIRIRYLQLLYDLWQQHNQVESTELNSFEMQSMKMFKTSTNRMFQQNETLAVLRFSREKGEILVPYKELPQLCFLVPTVSPCLIPVQHVLQPSPP